MANVYAPHSDVFFDRARLLRYLEELGSVPFASDKHSIDELLKVVQEKQLYTVKRPHSMEDELYGSKTATFANNELLATKVSFSTRSGELPSPLVVWVSDPPALAEPRNAALNEGAFEGCFVILIESHWRPDPVDRFDRIDDSCLSWLLQELVNASVVTEEACKKLSQMTAPLEQLKALGGRLDEPRKINVLYRKSRISSVAAVEAVEKKFGFFSSKLRREFNDMIGHPILIGSV
ncbi:MAG: hypothetical protein AAF483_27350 [Planctomycetota bacterium]